MLNFWWFSHTVSFLSSSWNTKHFYVVLGNVFLWTLFPTSCSKSNTERYFLSQFQWCVRTGFSSSTIFPLTKHQTATVASSTWQALVLHHPMAVLLVLPALDRTVRTMPNQQHLSQHFLGWECGQEENPKPGAKYSPEFTLSLIAQCFELWTFLCSLLLYG